MVLNTQGKLFDFDGLYASASGGLLQEDQVVCGRQHRVIMDVGVMRRGATFFNFRN